MSLLDGRETGSREGTALHGFGATLAEGAAPHLDARRRHVALEDDALPARAPSPGSGTGTAESRAFV